MLKRVVSSLLAVVLIGMAAGCGNSASTPSGGDAPQSGSSGGAAAGSSSAAASAAEKEEGPVSPAGELPITKEITEITAFAEVDPKMDLDNNAFLQMVEEKTNIRLKITVRPSNLSDVKTTRNLMMASNDYPDVFMPWNNSYFTMSEILTYGMKDGTFIPLNDLLDEYGFELKRIFETVPEFKKIMTAPDGNLYALSKMTQCGHCRAYPKLWVNQEWMQALNIEEPQTTEEFYQMLKAFKEQDPNGNGAADEIPLTAETGAPLEAWVVNSFLPFSIKSGKLAGANHCYIDDADKIVFSADKPAFKEALQYMHKLYSEGLIDIAAYSQNSDQMKQSIRQTPVKIGAFVANVLGGGIDIQDPKAMATYVAMTPVAGPEGVRYQSSVNGKNNLSGYANSTGFFAISDRCKNPEAAFRMVDFMMNEDVTFAKQYGVEGVDWKHAEPGQKNIAGGELGYERIVHGDDTELGKSYIDRYLNAGPTGNLFAFRERWSADVTGEALNEAANYEPRLEKETARLAPYFYPKELPNMMFSNTAEELEEFAGLAENINNHVTKNTALFVIGTRDIDAEWDAYISELNSFNLSRFLELYQTAYDNFIQ